MAELSPQSAGPTSLLPEVRLEVRQGSARPLLYEVTDVAFLIGSVSGCDLRLPGADLPPVICMIIRRSGRLAIRRLASTHPLHVNGHPLSNHSLSDGDRITLGTLELVVHAHFPVAPEEPAERLNKTSAESAHSSSLVNPPTDLETRQRELDARQRQLEEQAQKLESERLAWQARRQEIEREQRLLHELQRDFAEASAKLRIREEAVEQAQEAVERKRQIEAEASQLADRLAELQESREEWRREESAHRSELGALTQEIGKATEQVAKAKQELDQLRQQILDREQDLQRQSAAQDAEFEPRERQIKEGREALDAKRLQYEADVIRLDRLASSLEERQRQLEGRAKEVDERYEQMQRDSRDMEEQANQLHEWHKRLCSEADEITRQKAESDALASDVAKRSSDIEGQQATFASLRTKLERAAREPPPRRAALDGATDPSRTDGSRPERQGRGVAPPAGRVGRSTASASRRAKIPG